MNLLKQSTSRHVMAFMTDAADNASGKTGLTLTITASKDGAAFASISPTVTERGNGWYDILLDTTQTNTLGDLALHITGTGALANDMVLQVVVELPGVITAASVQAIWDALTSALTTVGSIGKRLADDIDATISSRASQTSLDTVAGYVDTEVAAIKAKTDNLPTDPADASDIASAFGTVNSTLATIAGYIDTEVAAIKAKTDNLPASPASTGDVTSAQSAIIAALPYGVKKNVAIPGWQFPMYSLADSTGMEGLSVTLEISKDGGAFVASTNPVVEISDGWYSVDFTATELNAKMVAVRAFAVDAVTQDWVFNTEV